jgi:hypothetical protein
MNLVVEKKYIYLKMAAKAIMRSPSMKTFGYLLRYFSPWQKYLDKGRNAVIDQQPWLTFPAIDYIKTILHPAMRVFEYGSGGSTLFWAKQAREVISVEHDHQWFELMKQQLEQLKMQNVSYFFIPPRIDEHVGKKDPGNPTDYVSADEDYRNNSFLDYASFIDRFEPESFDIILIDGRARPSCIAHSISKLKRNGYLIVDNSERAYYLEGFKFSGPGWKVRSFFGPVPYTYSFSETTIIEKK